MSPLLDRITALLAAPAPREGARGQHLLHVEQTLTDGYAEALALEAERSRLNRRIREAAAQLEDGDAARASEICGLARRLANTDGDLVRLRTVLGALRARAQELRA